MIGYMVRMEMMIKRAVVVTTTQKAEQAMIVTGLAGEMAKTVLATTTQVWVVKIALGLRQVF